MPFAFVLAVIAEIASEVEIAQSQPGWVTGLGLFVALLVPTVVLILAAKPPPPTWLAKFDSASKQEHVHSNEETI